MKLCSNLKNGHKGLHMEMFTMLTGYQKWDEFYFKSSNDWLIFIFIVCVGFFLNCSVEQYKAIGIKRLNSENSPSILF